MHRDAFPFVLKQSLPDERESSILKLEIVTDQDWKKCKFSADFSKFICRYVDDTCRISEA